MKKLCYVCSSGGHWEEALRLRSKLDSIPSLTVTEEERGIPEASRESVCTFHPLRRTDPLLLLRISGVFFRSLVLLRLRLYRLLCLLYDINHFIRYKPKGV